jgi:hypothetical protein
MSPAARSPRRRHHRTVGRHPRFLIATLLTIVVVAFVVVPWVASLVDALGTYGPSGYEPKDFKRGEFQRRLTDPASWTAEHVFNAGLFVLLAVVWYISLNGGPPGSRSR